MLVPKTRGILIEDIEIESDVFLNFTDSCKFIDSLDVADYDREKMYEFLANYDPNTQLLVASKHYVPAEQMADKFLMMFDIYFRELSLEEVATELKIDYDVADKILMDISLNDFNEATIRSEKVLGKEKFGVLLERFCDDNFFNPYEESLEELG